MADGRRLRCIHGSGETEILTSMKKSILISLLALLMMGCQVSGGIIGGGLSIVAALTLGEGNVLVLLWLLFILRMLNRTSGSRHKIGDNVFLIFIAYWLGKDGYWLYPVLTGTAYIIESQIRGGYYRSLYLGGLAFAVTAMADTSMKAHSLSMIYVYLMALCFILFLPEIRMAAVTEAKGDIDGKRISPQRLQVAQGAFLMIGFSVPWAHPEAAPGGEIAPAQGLPGGIAGIIRHRVAQLLQKINSKTRVPQKCNKYVSEI